MTESKGLWQARVAGTCAPRSCSLAGFLLVVVYILGYGGALQGREHSFHTCTTTTLSHYYIPRHRA